MCLLILGWHVHPRYSLVVAANRDEFHERPSLPLGKWDAPHDILAGRDVRAGGTWLGVDGRRRFAVVTNFRDLQRPLPGAPSRGKLIPAYLAQPQGPQEFLDALKLDAAAYSGFNLLLAHERNLWYATNRAKPFARALAPGVHGLSNRFLDTPWPKLLRVKRRFAGLLDPAGASTPLASGLFDLLNDRMRATANEALPETGLSPEWEHALSSPFVLHGEYGTRCSTVLLLEPSGAMQLIERRFDAQGEMSGETQFTLRPGEWV